MRFFERLLFWIVGLVLAIPAAGLTLAGGVLLEPAARDLVARIGLAFLESLFTIAALGGDPSGVVLSLVAGFWVLSLVLVIAPVTLVSAVGEIAGLRNLVFYGGVTGLLTALVPWLARPGAAEAAAAAAEGRLTALLFVTGALAGLVYWAIAGRSAGRAQTDTQTRSPP